MHAILEEAMALKDEVIAARRQIHENAELGFDLPKTRRLVTDMLCEIGCEPKPLGGGITFCSMLPLVLISHASRRYGRSAADRRYRSSFCLQRRSMPLLRS